MARRDLPKLPGQRIGARVGRLVDQVAAIVSPRWGARRQMQRTLLERQTIRAEALGSYYGSPDDERLRGHSWHASRLSPDSGLEQDLDELRRRSSDLYRRNPWFHSYAEGLARYVVGTGRRPQSQAGPMGRSIPGVDTKQFRKAAERVWAAWSKNAGPRGESLAELQTQLVVGRAIEGDQLAVVRRDPLKEPIPLSLEIISGVRVETPPEHSGDERVRNGVEYDHAGRVVAYHVRTHPGDTLEPEQWRREPVYDRAGRRRAFLYRRPGLEGASRGQPDAAPVQDLLRDLADYQESEIVRMQTQSSNTAYIKSDPEVYDPVSYARGSSIAQTANGERLEDYAAGRVEYLLPGQEVQLSSPNGADSQLDPFVRWQLRAIAAGLSWSYELLTKHYENSYAGGRLALIDAHRRINTDAQLLDDQVLTPLWCQVQVLALMAELLPVDDATFLAHEQELLAVDWMGEPLPWIDPAREIEAEAMGVYLGLDTFEAMLKRRNLDWDEWRRDRVTMREMQAEVGMPDLVPRGWGLNERVPKQEIGNPAARPNGQQGGGSQQQKSEPAGVPARAAAAASLQPGPAADYQPTPEGVHR